jgi:hypothetical protein
MDALKMDMIKLDIKKKYNTGCILIFFKSILDVKKVLKNPKEFLSAIKPDRKIYNKYNLGNWELCKAPPESDIIWNKLGRK